MRGGMGQQVTEIFNRSGIFTPGTSKHAEKAEARKAGAKTWADLGRSLTIYSHNTAESYKDVWHQFADFAKSEMGLNDLEKIDASHISGYLLYRIDRGIAYSTWAKEAAALAKLENAMNMYSDVRGHGNEYNFRQTIRACGADARQELSRHEQHRAYQDPGKLISAIADEKNRIAASIQYEGGARIHETSLVKSSQMAGYGRDTVSGKDIGRIRIMGGSGKGGKERTIQVSVRTYKALAVEVVRGGGTFQIKSKDSYRADLRQAARQTGQTYNGSHGLRWSYAQERMEKCQTAGRSYEQSLVITSYDMGHQRADITEHYLQ